MDQAEQDMLDAIKALELEKKAANASVRHHRNEVSRYESDEIAASIEIDVIKERLARHRAMYPKYVEELRDKDIREFTERLPEVMKKLQ